MSKTYINGISVKEKEGQYGSFFNVSINIDKIKEHANEKGYVNMTVSKRKEVWQYGETHSCTLNEWKYKQENKSPDDISVEDLPFS